MTGRSIPVAVTAALPLAVASQPPEAQRTAPTAKASPPAAAAPAHTGPERVDLVAVYRLEDEGLQRSQGMESASHLTDMHGPRLKDLPNMACATNRAARHQQRSSVADAGKEPW